MRITGFGECVPVEEYADGWQVMIERELDDEHYERRHRMCGTFECPKCGLVWPLHQETEDWTEAENGAWVHAGYGMPNGWCQICNLAVHAGFDEDYVIDLNELKPTGEGE